jgi:hypothetical protein
MPHLGRQEGSGLDAVLSAARQVTGACGVSSIDAALAIWDLKLQSPSPPQGANEPSRSITDNVGFPYLCVRAQDGRGRLARM